MLMGFGFGPDAWKGLLRQSALAALVARHLGFEITSCAVSPVVFYKVSCKCASF